MKTAVVLAADNGYGFQLFAALCSLVMHTARRDMDYMLLVSSDFDPEIRSAASAFLTERGFSAPQFIDMGNRFSDQEMKIRHITCATYYRLLLPTLAEGYEKCVYLDADIIAGEGWDSLLDVDMKDWYLAGVRAAAYYYPENRQEERAALLGIPRFDRYVNAGVLVMNLEKMREERLEEVFMRLLEKQFRSQDQDILNAACYDRIRILPPRYNLMTKYGNGDPGAYERMPALSLAYTREEWQEACESPFILHYADDCKPWNDTSLKIGEKWWETVALMDRYLPCMEMLRRKQREKETELLARIKEERTSLRTTAERKNEEILRLQDRNRSLQTACECAREQAALREEQRKAAEQRAGEQERRLQEMREQLARQQEQLKDQQERQKVLEQSCEKLQTRCGELNRKISLEREEKQRLMNSVSFRTGRALTFLPRRVRDFIRKPGGTSG